MTRLIVTTSKRNAPVHEVSGNFFIVDLDNKKILKKTVGIDPPYRHLDINPRGGMRGLRGVAIHQDKIAIANYSIVLIFNTTWNLVKFITHPLCSGIHEILFSGDSLWVTSAVNDELHQFDLNGNLKRRILIRLETFETLKVEHIKSASSFYRLYDFRVRKKYSYEKYDRVHVNSIYDIGNGEFLISLGLISSASLGILINIKTFLMSFGFWSHFITINQILRKVLKIEKKILTELIYQPSKWKSAVFKVDANGEWKLLFMLNDVVNPSHSVRLLSSGRGIYLNTSKGELVEFDPQTGGILLNTFISDKFLRGAVELPNGWLVVGAGNELLMIDINIRSVVDKIILSNDPLEAVHGLEIMPDSFDLPPDSLTDHLGILVGFDHNKILWKAKDNFAS